MIRVKQITLTKLQKLSRAHFLGAETIPQLGGLDY
jgi:hypothetical protein